MRYAFHRQQSQNWQGSVLRFISLPFVGRVHDSDEHSSCLANSSTGTGSSSSRFHNQDRQHAARPGCRVEQRISWDDSVGARSTRDQRWQVGGKVVGLLHHEVLDAGQPDLGDQTLAWRRKNPHEGFIPSPWRTAADGCRAAVGQKIFAVFTWVFLIS
jgi:hypothetical protein